MSKQVLVPPGADDCCSGSRRLVMAPALMCLAVLPFSERWGPATSAMGLVFVFAFGSIHVLALMLGGWASRNKYSIISAARVVSQNVAYEIPMLLVVITS
jgi:NADH-quinone oxidoreductase subunit H